MPNFIALSKLEFRVHGIPVQQGSKNPGISKKTGKLFVHEVTGQRLKTWRQVVTDTAVEARAAAGHQTFAGPVSLRVILLLPRPASVSVAKRPLPSVAPDLDKLVRAVGDALKAAGCYKDDAQICQTIASKKYATDDPDGAPGAYIVLWEMNEII